MQPIVFFAIILLVIWVLSAIASAISKQKEAQHRRQFRDDVKESPMAHGQAYRPPPPPQQRQYPVQSQRELNVGYGVRHPEMMSPPARMTAPPPMAPRARAPMRAPPALPRPQQRQQQPQRRAPRAVATRPMPGFAPPPPPIPVLEEDDAPRRRLVPAAPAPAAAGVRQQASQTATAPSIARWLKPATLRQQFILTEVFQPPLAMREERLG